MARFRNTAFGLASPASSPSWSDLSSAQWSVMGVEDWNHLPVMDSGGPFGFGGQSGYYFDPETNLYLLGGGGRGRYYDPQLARFQNADPTGIASGDPNLYRYVANDPVNRRDPSGNQDDFRFLEGHYASAAQQLLLDDKGRFVPPSEETKEKIRNLFEKMGVNEQVEFYRWYLFQMVPNVMQYANGGLVKEYEEGYVEKSWFEDKQTRIDVLNLASDLVGPDGVSFNTLIAIPEFKMALFHAMGYPMYATDEARIRYAFEDSRLLYSDRFNPTIQSSIYAEDLDYWVEKTKDQVDTSWFIQYGDSIEDFKWVVGLGIRVPRASTGRASPRILPRADTAPSGNGSVLPNKPAALPRNYGSKNQMGDPKAAARRHRSDPVYNQPSWVRPGNTKNIDKPSGTGNNAGGRLAPRGNLRQLYTDEVRGLEKVGKDLLASGKSEAEVAEILHGMRRGLGVKYKDMTPPDLLEYVHKFNEARYGDKLGPTLDLLRQQGKTNAQIIAGASRPLGDMKQLGAALHKQFGDEILPILRKYGMID